MKSGAGKAFAAVLVVPVALTLGYLFSRAKPDKPPFYVDYDLPADVWQIPIVDPYRLITADGSAKATAGYSRWNFQNNGLPEFHPDSINYEKGLIIYHDAAGNYGFFDTRRKKLYQAKAFSHFLTFADSIGVSRQLYHTEAVYTCWQQTRQLPWAKEIFARYRAATTLK